MIFLFILSTILYINNIKKEIFYHPCTANYHLLAKL